MSTIRDPNAKAAAALRASLEDTAGQLSISAARLREKVKDRIDEKHRLSLDRLIDGDHVATDRSGESIAHLEAVFETAKRNLEQESQRPETRAHLNVELRAAQAAIGERRRALIALFVAIEHLKKIARAQAVIPPPSVTALSIADVNNTWYLYDPDAETVVVFVHGILSDGRTCWLNVADPAKPVFWPELVAGDDRFDHPSIFLGGYYTAFDSGTYEIRDAALELYDALNRTDEKGRAPVMDWDNVIFVCHSTGGIVVRYMLDRWFDDFAKKNVGLVLIASPSYGSDLADMVAYVSELYAQKMARQLQWGNESLTDLDDRFRSLIDERRIPGLVGVEAFENRFIVHAKWLWWFNLTRIVTKESAARYFANARQLRETDHFTSVKPANRNHPAYQLLLDFYTHKFRPRLG